MALADPETIKAAILHPEPAIRERAVRYFEEVGSIDPMVMPRVIHAVEHYGLGHTWRMLLSVRPLPQTPETIEWVITQLQQPFDRDDVDQDNQYYALAWLLVEAEPALLEARYRWLTSEIDLPARLRDVLDERLALHRSGWGECWERFEALGREVIDAGAYDFEHLQRFARVMEALVRHGRGQREPEKFVLNLVRRQFPRQKRELYEAIEPQVLNLAGRMQLTRTIPLLLRRLTEEHDADMLCDGAVAGLRHMGGDEVVQPLAHAWWRAESRAHMGMAEVLGHIRTELAAERCLMFLQHEHDDDVMQMLAHATMRQFNTEALEPVAQFVADDALLEDDVEWRDVRLALVETATIMGVPFVQYDQWYEQAKQAPWGWQRQFPQYRLSAGPDAMLDTMRDAAGFEDDPDLIWRLKVVLKGIEPPIWRQLELPDCPLDELHFVIQKAFGWEDSHLYAFRANGVDYAEPGMMDEDGPPTEDATDTFLSDVVRQKGDRLEYIYDFGDHWEHAITVEQVWETEDPFVPPVCLAGERAGPPEEVGGPPGYARYLEVLADPAHEEHQDMLDWNGPFDPEAFDREAVNAVLRKGYDEWEAQMVKEVDEVAKAEDLEMLDTLEPKTASDEPPLPLADDHTPQYPLGTVAMYGPDEATTTKIVAAVFAGPNAEPVLERWVGTGVAENDKVQGEIRAFLERHGAKHVVATDGNMGCPHEAGEDFPKGEDCPFCPAWRGKQ